MSEFYTSQLDKEEKILEKFDEEYLGLVNHGRVRHLPVEQDNMEVVCRGFVRADQRMRAVGQIDPEEVEVVERYADTFLAWLETEIKDAECREKITCNRMTDGVAKALQIRINESPSEEERLNIRARYLLLNPVYGAWRAMELLRCAKGRQSLSQNRPESLLKVPSVVF